MQLVLCGEILPSILALFMGGLASSSAALLPHLHVQCPRNGVTTFTAQTIHYVSHHIPNKKAVLGSAGLAG